MAYDKLKELQSVLNYYNNDHLQKRFSALITGESGSGKSFLARTCRQPVHIDSFDPGGTKSIRDMILTQDNPKGTIVADTQWENEDPLAPTAFKKWKDTFDLRVKTGYFDMFGTYIIDSASTWGDAVMNFQLDSVKKPGEAPKWNRDYVPQKTFMINYVKKMMNLPCDFIMTGHLQQFEETIGTDKSGNDIKNIYFRFFTTGKAMVTIPLQFDELYVMQTKRTPRGYERTILTDAQGKYIARSRLRGDGKLDEVEKADIKHILKKVGLDWKDKPKLNTGGE